MTLRKLLIASLALGLYACGGGDPTPVGPVEDDMFGLDEASLYEEGRAISADAPSEVKFDQTLPASFDLVATQSPVKSQGSRGVCSIFGSIALMEHLYISEGTLAMPDFSEQFLQWSSKVEARAFPNTGGSNARSNLDALARFGTVFESESPYNPSPWGTSNDPGCTGDSQPTQCYTQGTPSDEALMARRWRIPTGRYIRSDADSIKSHMFNTNTAVQIGGDFYYQSWGHGGSRIPVYSGYREQGYILMPNQADIDSSREHSAGHSYIAVGWDDDLEVQSVDGEGHLAVDADGNPVMQKGFFLIKNSWGTGWATRNPHGAGYGWIAYEYVERFLSAYASGIPEVMVDELCGDGVDNDRNGAIDCADAACASDRSCVDPSGTYSNTDVAPIPDNDPAGVTSTLEVVEGGTISGLSVSVDITHPYRGDLTVTLSKGGTSVVLVDRDGAGADDIVDTFDVSEFDGEDSAGVWTLTVVDHANADEGQLNGWNLDITRCAGGDCDSMPTVGTYSNETLAVIPDNDAAGVNSVITVPDGGSITATRVTVNVTHPYISDLTITLSKGGTTATLIEGATVEGTSLMRTFTVSDFNGDDSAGAWTLHVVDGAARDEGTLDSWSLELTR